MECQISIDDKKVEDFLGKKISAEEFAAFCQDAIASKMFLHQFTTLPDIKRQSNSKPYSTIS